MLITVIIAVGDLVGHMWMHIKKCERDSIKYMDFYIQVAHEFVDHPTL